MTTDVKGAVKVEANGKVYTLWLGMSVLAELQAKHGQDVFARFNPPEDAPEGWAPELGVVHDLFMGALERYHHDEADRWLVDDIIKQNDGALGELLAGAFPESAPEPAKVATPGNRKGPVRAA